MPVDSSWGNVLALSQQMILGLGRELVASWACDFWMGVVPPIRHPDPTGNCMITLYACGEFFLTLTTTAKFQRCAISMNLVAKEIGRVQGSVYLWCREMSTMVLYIRPNVFH